MTLVCPICQKPITKDFSPFCSQRCKMVDLNRWLKGTYAVPGPLVPQEET